MLYCIWTSLLQVCDTYKFRNHIVQLSLASLEHYKGNVLSRSVLRFGTLIVQCCRVPVVISHWWKQKSKTKMWQLALADRIDTPVALSAETRRGNANSQQRGRGMPENVFVMYGFLGSHVAVSSGCMCERALCLQRRFLGSANQMD